VRLDPGFQAKGRAVRRQVDGERAAGGRLVQQGGEAGGGGERDDGGCLERSEGGVGMRPPRARRSRAAVAAPFSTIPHLVFGDDDRLHIAARRHQRPEHVRERPPRRGQPRDKGSPRPPSPLLHMHFDVHVPRPGRVAGDIDAQRADRGVQGLGWRLPRPPLGRGARGTGVGAAFGGGHGARAAAGGPARRLRGDARLPPPAHSRRPRPRAAGPRRPSLLAAMDPASPVGLGLSPLVATAPLNTTASDESASDAAPATTADIETDTALLPRHTVVRVQGNARTKPALVGMRGRVRRAVGLGGWHWLVGGWEAVIQGSWRGGLTRGGSHGLAAASAGGAPA